jgi:alkylated DNA repair protein alkB family protein 4
VVVDGQRVHAFDLATQRVPTLPDFRGVRVFEDLLDATEAQALLEEIERRPFAPSQSGRSKQHYGAKVNFNKRRVNVRGFEGLPGYATELVDRFAQRWAVDATPDTALARDKSLAAAFADFVPSDVFVLRYAADRRSNLDLHLDDTFAYGDLILDLSLESESVLTFYRGRPGGEVPADPDAPVQPACVRVPLPARSMAAIHGPARFEWEHGILANDVRGRRTSVTLRTLSRALRETEDGRRLLEACRRSPTQRSPRRASAS